mmetsp:Transcript_25240/g.51518  ORF Transcript_25240/g.51518 Transcript_25240/m.51518 type:complete len:244 (+) Transcript_25240:203-934(+)
MTASLPLQITTGVLCASYWRGAWYVLDYTLFPTDRTKSGFASLALGGSMLACGQYILSPQYNGTKLIVRMLPAPKSVSLRTHFMKTNRFVSLYGIAMSCVLVWRGTWLLWDEGADWVADAFSRRSIYTSSTWSDGRTHAGTQAVRALPVDTVQNPRASLHNAIDKHHSIDHEAHDAVTHHDIDDVLLYSGIASHVVATIGLLFIGRFKSVMAPPANVSIMRDLFIHGKGKSFARDVRAFTRTS